MRLDSAGHRAPGADTPERRTLPRTARVLLLAVVALAATAGGPILAVCHA
jgi:hypothetical protein